MWLKIKNDVIRLDEVIHFNFNDADKAIVISLRRGASFVFSQQFIHGVVSRDRVISPVDYTEIKQKILMKLNPEGLI